MPQADDRIIPQAKKRTSARRKAKIAIPERRTSFLRRQRQSN
jgi:hypothetical protein